MRPVLYVLGGLCAGSGILSAVIGGFGAPDSSGARTAVATQLSHVGNDAIGDLTIFPMGYAAIGLLLVGVAILAYANAGAWEETGGY